MTMGSCHQLRRPAGELDQALALRSHRQDPVPELQCEPKPCLRSQEVAAAFLERVRSRPSLAAGVELRGDPAGLLPRCGQGRQRSPIGRRNIGLVLAVKVVARPGGGGMAHIAAYGSRHTELICTTNTDTAECFLAHSGQ